MAAGKEVGITQLSLTRRAVFFWRQIFIGAASYK
jgi:hypothetical protein